MGLNIEQLQATIQLVSVPTFVVDKSGKIVAWNKAMNDETGVSFQSVSNKKSKVVFLPLRKSTPADTVLKTGETCKEDFVFTSGDKEKTVQFIADPIFEKNKIIGVFVQFQPVAQEGMEILEVTKEIIKEVPVEVVKEVEVIKEVEIIKEVASGDPEKERELQGVVNALDRVQAVIFFKPDGTIIKANDNFLGAVGYTLKQIQGKHHSIFVDKEYSKSEEYQDFWKRLQAGEFVAGRFKRFSKSGKEVWIQASYNPIFDKDGNIQEIVKFASDITAEMAQQQKQEGMVAAIDRAQAVIFFEPDGTILEANGNFLSVMGYSQKEVQGQHHGIFVDDKYRESEEYAVFWGKLRSGKYLSGRFKRFSKSGDEVWIQASYNPIFNEEGKVIKIVKYASDITAEMAQQQKQEGMIAAIDRAQAVIFFEPNGTILEANDNFLSVMGYSLEEVQGHHHGIFVDEDYRNSREYVQFWDSLRAGEYASGRFKRFSKSGDEVWIQASYNPIFNEEGKVIKIVKYASDITAEMAQQQKQEGMVSAISRSQAVIFFEPDGTILEANDNFLSVMGYSLEEIQGQHHSIFVDDEYRESDEYAQFWKRLEAGEIFSDRFKRISKSGDEVWIQASYNPIFNLEGKVTSVVKFASDITEEVQREAKEEKRKLVEQTTFQAVETVDELVFLAFQMKKGLTTIKEANGEGLQQIQSVAIASEELAAAIQDIAKKSEEADVQSQQAEQKLTDTSGVVKNISAAAEDVSSIVSLIDEVASQTNLLALNAAIEAARAGEAGRGFGVVASEVKELSRQTRKATQDIAKKITVMQEATQKGNDAIESVVSSVQEMNQLVGAISTAMIEQASVTEELSRNGEYAVAKNTEIVEKTDVIEVEVKELEQKVLGLNELMVALQEGYG